MKYYTNTAMVDMKSNCDKADAEMLLQGARKVDLDEFPKLKYLYRAGVGSENLPLEQIEQRGIQVFFPPMSVREEISKAVAELTVSFIMHSNTFGTCNLDFWERTKRPSLAERKVLVIGNGNIGSLVERMLPTQTKVYDIRCSMPTELEGMMRWADTVTLHIPSKCINLGTVVAFNHHFMDAEKLSWFKGTLINTSRGDVVVETDVIDWLDERGNRYYADVYECEPYDEVFCMRNNSFFGTPHMASYNTRVVQGNTGFAMGLMKALDGESNETPVSEG